MRIRSDFFPRICIYLVFQTNLTGTTEGKLYTTTAQHNKPNFQIVPLKAFLTANGDYCSSFIIVALIFFNAA